ncbi:MAG: hypothetical protein HY747_09290 [Elusimicrobia bacterium]|nr:hypothetical protein [Elusimicrobiota bacterium]
MAASGTLSLWRRHHASLAWPLALSRRHHLSLPRALSLSLRRRHFSLSASLRRHHLCLPSPLPRRPHHLPLFRRGHGRRTWVGLRDHPRPFRRHLPRAAHLLARAHLPSRRHLSWSALPHLARTAHLLTLTHLLSRRHWLSLPHLSRLLKLPLTRGHPSLPGYRARFALRRPALAHVIRLWIGGRAGIRFRHHARSLLAHLPRSALPHLIGTNHLLTLTHLLARRHWLFRPHLFGAAHLLARTHLLFWRHWRHLRQLLSIAPLLPRRHHLIASHLLSRRHLSWAALSHLSGVSLLAWRRLSRLLELPLARRQSLGLTGLLLLVIRRWRILVLGGQSQDPAC